VRWAVFEPEVLSSTAVAALLVLILCATVGMSALTMPLYFRSSLFDQPPTYGRPSSGSDVEKTWKPMREHLQRRAETFRVVSMCVCVPVATAALLVLVLA
jgi:hypothetical protein